VAIRPDPIHPETEMRRALDTLYAGALASAGLLIAAICLLISAQIVVNAVGRWAPGLLPVATIPSYADFSGFMLAGATFLALAPTLRQGGHIRVNLVVRRLQPGAQAAVEAAALAVALAATVYALWFVWGLVAASRRFGDVSSGIVPVPLWIPQTVTLAGLALLAVALADLLVEVARTRRPVLSTPDEV
jgi:TRAP-type C4-dicarboxylate transport system permease small subunit